MLFLGPTPHKRLNEVIALVFLASGVYIFLSLISYQSTDPSWNAVSSVVRADNLMGRVGAHIADLCFQILGLASFVLPPLFALLGWKWLFSKPIETPWAKLCGAGLLIAAGSVALSLAPSLRMFASNIPAGGLVGFLFADYLIDAMNVTGAALFTLLLLLVSLYLISTFTVQVIGEWLTGPIEWLRFVWEGATSIRLTPRRRLPAVPQGPVDTDGRIVDPLAAPKGKARAAAASVQGTLLEMMPPSATPSPATSKMPPIDLGDERAPWEEAPAENEIPIRVLEDQPPLAMRGELPATPAAFGSVSAVDMKGGKPSRKPARPTTHFELPSTTLLNEPPERNSFDAQELKETAANITTKLKEFNVLGSVVQINPGPVVTTFEFRPEAGIKVSKITTLTEDLSLGLEAESIIIERIPGKSTVGVEVPNRRREMISLRQMIESEEFQSSPSRLTIAMGKDVNGRIKMFQLETMPHLLVAGSTGSGKSVMLNALIMSILYKSTPEEVRMILVDPKRVEMGMYEGIPHLLTPVITDPRKATNALRNAVLEMERRLKLLAERGVRNIDQYNKKVRLMAEKPRSLFEDEAEEEEDLRPLPYILIVIDELADLMMLERANVEESVARLAQMARAVGMHLVLATQRPSVDVITGLIKANFPARISFRVATRVDSRTVLDVMGAEHLLGKGDMLCLPPGSSRLVRLHGAFVTEQEVFGVVDFWKQQARPEYDQSYLIAPPSDDDAEAGDDEEVERDQMYEEAVKVVCDVGKASTSVLQRRLRLGYGRAARILDMMQREGIIGPPDGSRPRDVLRTPDWINRVDDPEMPHL
jgi:S-DNA-T family DNA segregation ATPase FtsK/SpoIIIE